MPGRTGLPPYPNGWFVVGFSDEVRPGRVLARQFMGQEVVVFRTRSGKACAADAYCPHLGAHFGYGGSVEGEWLRCPFHGFCFDAQGSCVKTGYGTKPPPAARLKLWPLREQNGLLLLYHDGEGAQPTWEVVALETEGWARPIYRVFTLRDHPQETTENSVDIGHFAIVHKYRDVRELREMQTDGPFLSTAYAVRRAAPLVGRVWRRLSFAFEFETQIYGLGYSLVQLSVPALRLRARLWVLSTPRDEERLTLWLAMSARIPWTGRAGNPLARLPGKALAWLLARLVLMGLAHDARQDFPIWEHKRYVQRPALAQGDGPIGRYRLWARQFYGQER